MELDELFSQLDPDASGGIVFRELQLAILAAARESHPSVDKQVQPYPYQASSASQGISHSPSQPSELPSIAPSHSASPRSHGHWATYDSLEQTEVTGVHAGVAHISGTDERSISLLASRGGLDEAVAITQNERSMLEEIIDTAIAEAAQQNSTGSSCGTVTLLRILTAYEAVLEQHGIPTIEDTRLYQLLLQLSLLPIQDWHEKLATLQSQSFRSILQGLHHMLHIDCPRSLEH